MACFFFLLAVAVTFCSVHSQLITKDFVGYLRQFDGPCLDFSPNSDFCKLAATKVHICKKYKESARAHCRGTCQLCGKNILILSIVLKFYFFNFLQHCVWGSSP
ncbi:uncharacterized protein LOC130629602 [Hydractinia symbiolongicarpus]|uniref:uncharacterized protein LOC130629602 n=1 Tax=Hydractinia symbiolongicarpus TaxID=13093 RepID=UPI002551807C|nr:uncharacterized protein LOC130629602 [Hydractinia symbiolongicarpus]